MATSKQIQRLTKDMEEMWLSDDDFVIESSDEESDDKMIGEPIIEPDLKTQSYSHCVLSIDIGIQHLGISVTLLNADYSIMEIVWIDLIDIQKYTHDSGPSKKECKLHHTKSFCDWITHVFQENSEFFERADTILIERQPPMGLVGIEQLIFSRWRDKAVLISPNSMHKFFHIGHYDYEQRKEQTSNITRKYLYNHSTVLDKFETYERCHDIADSVCMMLFWIKKKQTEYSDNLRKEEVMKMQMNIVYDRKKDGYRMSVNDWFNQFRYRGQYARDY
jgi:hypothetical protein